MTLSPAPTRDTKQTGREESRPSPLVHQWCDPSLLLSRVTCHLELNYILPSFVAQIIFDRQL